VQAKRKPARRDGWKACTKHHVEQKTAAILAALRSHLHELVSTPLQRGTNDEEIMMNKQLIDDYVACGGRLRQAVSGLSPADLTARPGPGKWSIQELVVHLADSDAIAIDRMKRILTEENPPLLYADETAYVDRLYSHDQSLEDALLLFDVGRRQFARVLRKLSDADGKRQGTHNKRGPVTVDGMVKSYIDHVDHHLKFVTEKRAKLGKPPKA
jgi:uncharacterized damage-inducible protein DinB